MFTLCDFSEIKFCIVYCIVLFKGEENWVSNVKKLMYDYRFNYVFGNQTVVNEVVFSSMFKQRIIDCFLQEWYTSKSNCSMLTLLQETINYPLFEHT